MARLVDVIEAMIKQMIEENNGSATISRSTLAEQANCVPSQITYVLSTRFSTQGAKGLKPTPKPKIDRLIRFCPRCGRLHLLRSAFQKCFLSKSIILSVI